MDEILGTRKGMNRGEGMNQRLNYGIKVVVEEGLLITEVKEREA